MFTNEQAQATFDLVQRELGKDGGELSLIVGATILAGWVYARYIGKRIARTGQTFRGLD
jgi:hypothetical protein